ncbi:MAG: hypothetical protein ACT4N4_15665 [Rhodospirillales bacterium]
MKETKLDDFERQLEARIAKAGFAGNGFVRPNEGTARTEEKRILLAKLDELNRAGARPLFFAAKY